jgi:hypothetical protein
MKRLYPLSIASPRSTSDCLVRSPFWTWKGRSPFPPLSQKRAIYLLNSTSARSPFWLRMFLQGRAIALHLYQMPNLRSPFWNKSKRAIAFWLYGKGDRSFWYGKGDRSFGIGRSIAFLDRGISLFGSTKGDRFSEECSKLMVEIPVKACVPRASKYDKVSKSTRLQDIPAMKLISLSAHFDGQSIQLDEPYKLEPNIKLIVTVLPEQLAEREAWLWLSRHQLNNAYSQDDDYPTNAIKTLNPDYAGS